MIRHLVMVLALLWSTSLLAHSGVLDENGGHIDKETGEYHTHINIVKKVDRPKPQPDKPAPKPPEPEPAPAPEVAPDEKLLYEASLNYWEARTAGAWAAAYVFEQAKDKVTLEQYMAAARPDPWVARYDDGRMSWKVAAGDKTSKLVQIEFYSADNKLLAKVVQTWILKGDRWLRTPDDMVKKIIKAAE